MGDKLPAKTVKFMSLKNLYIYNTSSCIVLSYCTHLNKMHHHLTGVQNAECLSSDGRMLNHNRYSWFSIL